jgi:GLPGLI family protein
MKKKLPLFLLLFFALAAKSSAQNNGQIRYEFKFPSLTRKSITVNALLSFGDSTSIFTYYKISLEDSIGMLSRIVYDSARGAVISATEYDEKGTQIYRDFKARKMILRQSTAKPMDPFVVTDDWVNIDWKTGTGQKNILGYTCQKATGYFRGRTYTAWYTTAIPLPYGPWKLFGLPGVILEAADEDGVVHLLAKKMTLTDTLTDSIQIPRETVAKTIRQYVHDDDFYMEQVETAFKQKLPPGMSIQLSEEDRTTPQKIKRQRKFRLEKKYEWERENVRKGSNNINIYVEGK